jgi:hypothetical protein
MISAFSAQGDCECKGKDILRRKSISAVAALAALASLAATPGQAATIVQVINPMTRSIGDLTPFDINAVPFNTALGTRTGISVELIGSYTPASDIDVLGTVPATVTLTAHLFVFAALGR